MSPVILGAEIDLLTGAGPWSTHPSPDHHIRAMYFSDGSSGVRGASWTDLESTVIFPAPVCIGASWDPDLARRVGEHLAGQAKAKGVDVVLAPVLNLQRTPRSGRHFEAFAEDPLLVSELGAAYIAGLQRWGVAGCAKHYVGNDTETQRMTVSMSIDERTLREVYLAPFEDAVRAGVWTVMCSYNAVNGISMANSPLLHSPLKDEWGFDGVVVSDWGAVRSTVPPALAGMDLVMPGPVGPWGAALAGAVADGQVPAGVIGDKVERLIRLATRVGAHTEPEAGPPASTDGPPTSPDGPPLSPEGSPTSPEGPPLADNDFLTEAVAAGTVLVRNRDQMLPWRPQDVESLAVIGHHAVHPRIQGGGSASLMPHDRATPLAALRQRFAPAPVRYAVGAPVEGINPVTDSLSRDPSTGEPGMCVRYLAADGAVLHQETRRYGAFLWVGEPGMDAVHTVEVAAVLTVRHQGRYSIGFGGYGGFELAIDGVGVWDERIEIPAEADPVESFFDPPERLVQRELDPGTPVDVRLRFEVPPNAGHGVVGFSLGIEVVRGDVASELARAVELARGSSHAVVVVGLPLAAEAEGLDRDTLALPPAQDRLVRQVCEVNPRTVVVVNAGGPVLMPWLAQAGAVVVPWLGGQQMGTALAAMLAGDLEPGGRMPCTWPGSESDVPVWQVEPVAGELAYRESIHVGYREWLRRMDRGGPRPAVPFGFGLGYTQWSIDSARLAPAADERSAEAGAPASLAEVDVVVSNVGRRRGKQVVQVYAAKPDSAVDRPTRWLVAAAIAHAEAGQRIRLRVPIPDQALRYWDTENHQWAIEPGQYQLLVGTDCLDAEYVATVTHG